MPIYRPSVSVKEARELAQGEKPKVRTARPDSEMTASVSGLQGAVKHSSLSRLPPSDNPECQIDKTQIFLSAELPRTGFSPSYDLLCKRYKPKKALQMVLRKALDDFEKQLLVQRFDGSEDGYPIQEPSTVVSTSRMMSQTVLNQVLTHFDPLGLESARAIGRRLATAALTAYFGAERAKCDGIATPSKTRSLPSPMGKRMTNR